LAKLNENNRGSVSHILPFEKRIVELEAKLEQAESDEERSDITRELDLEREKVFTELTPWQRVELARHAQRPKMLEYVSRVFEDFIELHGDRVSGDDTATVGGIARFRGQTVILVGQQKGNTTDERIRRNYGMAFPSGYRKALRLFEMAERLRLPVVTIVDTQGAHPHPDAEQRGQGPAIARNLLYLMGINTAVFSVVIGEGGSGGALGIAIGDWVCMFEHAIYMVCAPERCAEILWRDSAKKDIAASALRITAHDLKEFGVIDAVLPEPGGGAHRNPDGAAAVLAEEIDRFLKATAEGQWNAERRQEKFRRMGIWRDVV
jgi:acetyl-CoA carboxylase carboxyl transferase subunit alpha